MEEPPLSTLISLLSGSGVEVTPGHLRTQCAQLLQPFSDGQVAAAIQIVSSDRNESVEDENEGTEDGYQRTAFLRAEYDVLRASRDDKQLVINAMNRSNYQPDIALYFSRMMLLPKLKETRALAGFTRVFPENGQTLNEQKSLLWRHPPHGVESWLPAYVVYGEGIFLELDEDRLRTWESAEMVVHRGQRMAEHFRHVQQERKLRDTAIMPRFILLHTFSHLLMNELIFECGYSSAALRERLYVSDSPGQPMAGILIYTAAGDAEGTMGGLVRMGKPGYLEPVMLRALERARWCSADPVCMEMGARGGQGPDSCNLAACHNCALVPETACEHFNRFLDRGVVIGEINNCDLGFFI